MNLRHRLPLIAVTLTSVLCIAISIFSLKSGIFIVFQNLFYIPIVISCFYYTKKGFAISVALSCIYFLLIIAFTSDPMIIRDAVIRVCIFILIAAVITALSIARARAEGALKNEREKFRTVADFTYGWEYWTDPQQNLRYISPSCERISGYRPEDFMAESGLIHSVVHPDDRDIFKCHADHYHEAHIDSVGEVDFRIMDRNGEEHWIAHVCRPVYRSNGQFLGRRASNRDITDRKQAEEALRESEMRFRELFNHMSSGVAVYEAIDNGEDFIFRDFNPAAENIEKVSRKDILGKRVSEAFPGVKAFGVFEIFQRVWQTGKTEYYPENIYEDERNPGSWRESWVFKLPTGEIVTVYNDISGRKQTEEKLRQEQQFSKSVLESLPGIFYLYTYPEHRLVLWNKQHETLLGYTAEEMKDRFAMDWHLPEVKDAVLKATEEVMEKGHSSVESSLLAKEGHLVPFFLTGVRFEAQGRLYYMGIGTDITERKRAEEEKSKLEAQNRQLQKAESLGRMAGAIVHHFNNMLQAIIGNMQLAIRRLPRDEDSVKYMAAAMQAARSAETITSQTLTYLGDTSDKLETLDLGDVCRLFLPTLQAAMPKNVSLETDLPSRGPTITANANQMQQVLTNLVTNAWEALGDGRSIIHLRVKTVSAADIPAIHSPTDWRPQDSVYICLEVSDTGSGIAHSDIENLFDPFFSGKFIGRGLGLSVVLGIARAHHGAVSVQSEPGQGSTFCVFLPAAAEDVVV